MGVGLPCFAASQAFPAWTRAQFAPVLAIAHLQACNTGGPIGYARAMPSPRPTILLTGFGPFPGIAKNASALLAAKLGRLAASRFRAHRGGGKVLPPEGGGGPARL